MKKKVILLFFFAFRISYGFVALVLFSLYSGRDSLNPDSRDRERWAKYGSVAPRFSALPSAEQGAQGTHATKMLNRMVAASTGEA